MNQLLKKQIHGIANHYGYSHQSNIAMEELGELIQAISKNSRYSNEETKEELISEIADVYIMIEQMKHLIGISDIDVTRKIGSKVDRQMHRMIGEYK